MKIDNNELKGIIGTVVAHAVAVLILLLVVLKAPDPVGESGMDVLLGDATVSRGNAQQYQYTEVAAAPQPVPQPQDVLQSTAPKPVEEPAITQDDEETIAMPKPQKTEAEKRAEQERQEAIKRAEAERIEKERKAEEERQANELAMQQMASAFGGNTPTSGVGEPSDKPAQQGNTAGTPTGNIQATGSGVQGSFDLEGRDLVGGLPKPNISAQEEARVVVVITVDSNGNVISTSINTRRTNTADPKLRQAAMDAAKLAKFSKTSGVDNQSGTINYYFKVR